MHCPLTLCASAEVDRVLFHFLALVSLIPPKKCFSVPPHSPDWHLHIISTFLWLVGASGFDK